MMSVVFQLEIFAQDFDRRSAEVEFVERCLALAGAELRREHGARLSGTITGVSPGGVPNTALGLWTYDPAAKNS
jgi:hypothetical protein